MGAIGRVAILGVISMIGCGGPDELPCREPYPSSVVLPRVPLVVSGTEISAEVADDEEERADAWAGRHCELEGLLWVPEAVEPPAVTLCGVEVAVDLAFVRDGEIVALELDQSPCVGGCESCVPHGEQGPAVQAVLWLPTGSIELAEGDAISGLDAVSLPVEP